MRRNTDRYGKLVDIGKDFRFRFTPPFPTQMPIFRSNTFAVTSIEEFEECFSRGDAFYGRMPGHPNHAELEKKYAFLAFEGPHPISPSRPWCSADGMSTISRVLLTLLKPGDHIIIPLPVYPGVQGFISNYLVKFGVSVSYYHTAEAVSRPLEEILDRLVRPNTKLIHHESLTNPTLDITDERRIADWARPRNIILIDDITFNSVFIQNSLCFGSDIIIEALSKHASRGQALGAIFAYNVSSLNQKLEAWGMPPAEEVFKPIPYLGGTMAYEAAWDFSEKLEETFPALQHRARNALYTARWLEGKKGVFVKYPGLLSHPQYDIAQKQLVDEDGEPCFGSLVYFDIGGEERRAREFAKRVASTKKVMLTVSLCAPETIITPVWHFLCASLSCAEKEAMRITPTAFRLSVGKPPWEDLCDVLEHGFEGIG
ncbi:MAG: aminotransferase class I/II-fold pyridoxal phosphate-dependent enzyme [bacterium]|nr:aminotransferase class I/II-fold pyridoxal phosphate-dependent enzyme [bacterium]